MPHLSHSDPSTPSVAQRIERAIGDLNAVLLVLAIGLAVLDFTCFVGLMGVSEFRQAEQTAFLAGQANPNAVIGADRALR